MLLGWHELISSRVSVLGLVSLRYILFGSLEGPPWLMLFTHLQISQLWWCCGFVVVLFFQPLAFIFSFWNLKSCFDFWFSKWYYTLHFFYYEMCSCFFITIFKFDNYSSVIWSTVCSSGENFILSMDFLKMRFNGYTNTYGMYI